MKPAAFVARLLLAPTLVVAAALLVKGYSAPGDGFSAGTLAALAVVMQGAATGRRASDMPLGRTPLGAAIAGLTVMLAVVLAGAVLGGHLVQHWPPHGAPKPPGLGRLELHTAVLYDIGIAILVFVTIVSVIDLVAGQPSGGKRG